MQEIQMPSGQILREFFTEDEVRQGKANKRRRELEKQGGEFLRFSWVGVHRSKYTPHQGHKERERRRRQMERETA